MGLLITGKRDQTPISRKHRYGSMILPAKWVSDPSDSGPLFAGLAQERVALLRADVLGHQLQELVRVVGLLRRLPRDHLGDRPEVDGEPGGRLVDECLLERTRRSRAAAGGGGG